MMLTSCKMKNLVYPVALLLLLEVHSIQGKSGTWTQMPGTDSEYYYHPASVTWYGARAACMQMGADLVSIHNQTQLDFLKNLPDRWTSSNSWIGLNKLEGYFQWTDGSQLNFTSWTSGQPDNDEVHRKQCVYTNTGSGNWYNINCGLKKGGAFCSRELTSITPTPKTEPTTPSLPGYCPSGYIEADTKCYKLFSGSTAVTWDEALQACRSQPGRNPDLASFHSSRDNAFVTSQIKAKSTALWIGSKAQDYKLVWTDNSDTNFNNAGSTTTGCLSMVGSRPQVPGTWVWSTSSDCSERFGYICQTHKDPDNIISTPQPTTSHPCKGDFLPYGDGCYRVLSQWCQKKHSHGLVNKSPGLFDLLEQLRVVTGYSVRYEQEAATWSEAESTCADKGAHLVAIHSEAENAAVEVLSEGGDIWIGLKKGASGEYEWTNGWYVLYMRWSKESSNSGDCVKMYGENGTWQADNCDLKHPFICKVSTGPALTTPTPIEGRCPPEDGWVAHGSYCYLIQIQTGRTWYSAMEACLTHYPSAQLVSIHNMVDNDWIYKQIQNKTSYIRNMWIGLHRSRKDGTLRWVDGSPVQFQHWAVGSPGDQSCAVMSKDHKSMWVDQGCELTNAGYICKVPKIPLPTRPTQGPGSCPNDDWESYGESCFLYRPDELRRWFEAQELCLQEGGSLASVLSDDENYFIHKMMLKYTHLPKHRPYWTGGVRLNSSIRFGWLGGAAMVYSHWGKGFPTLRDGDCVIVSSDNSIWRNEDCLKRAGVVCRYQKVIMVTEPTPKSGMSGGAIAGLVIGLLVIVGLCMAVLYLLYTRRRPPTPPYPTFNNPLSHTNNATTTPPSDETRNQVY